MTGKLPVSNLIRILPILIFTILLNNSSSLAQAKLDKPEHELNIKQLKGYQIKFDYVNYLEERELAYQYFLDKYKDSETFSSIKISDIGIDLYDLDSDGKLEIFAYINYGTRCPSSSCPFVTLRKLVAQKGAMNYQIIPWSTPGAMDIMLSPSDLTEILETTTLGYHDILSKGEGAPITLWKWNGNHYEIFKVYEQ